MAAKMHRPLKRLRGYPSCDRVVRGIGNMLLRKPEMVYRTCRLQADPPYPEGYNGLLQTFRNITLAAQWVLQDIERRNPEKRFARHQKKRTSSFNTAAIATQIQKEYHRTISKRFCIAATVLEGVWEYLAWHLSSWLQQVTTARKKGLYKQHQKSAAFVIPIGQHRDKTIAELGRDRAKGYLSLPSREQCEEVLSHIAILQGNYPEDHEPRLIAEAFKVRFTAFERKLLGDLLPSSLEELRILVQRDLDRMAEIDTLKEAVQQFLKWTPPGFPHIYSDRISSGRREILAVQHTEALKDYGHDVEFPLAETEHRRFTQLQQAAFADTRPARFIPIIWKRADGILRHRGLGLGYDTTTKRYHLVGYVLADVSRYKHQLQVPENHEIIDINNPDIYVESSKRPIQAILFRLRCGHRQQRILDQARADNHIVKAHLETTRSTQKKQQKDADEEVKEPSPHRGGSLRSGSLHAHYDQEKNRWWFEAQLHIGTLPSRVKSPDHVVGINVDLIHGLTAVVLTLRGKFVASYHINDETVAWLLTNSPEEAIKPAWQRTTTEYHHRISSAICAIARRHRAKVGIENISYARERSGRLFSKEKNGSESIKTIQTLLEYKLQLEELPKAVEIRGVAPKRDCGACGQRSPEAAIEADDFICPTCGHRENRWINSAREVARRVLWNLTFQKPPRKKKLTA